MEYSPFLLDKLYYSKNKQPQSKLELEILRLEQERRETLRENLVIKLNKAVPFDAYIMKGMEFKTPPASS